MGMAQPNPIGTTTPKGAARPNPKGYFGAPQSYWNGKNPPPYRATDASGLGQFAPIRLKAIWIA